MLAQSKASRRMLPHSGDLMPSRPVERTYKRHFSTGTSEAQPLKQPLEHPSVAHERQADLPHLRCPYGMRADTRTHPVYVNDSGR
jgi:hypothetical protein